MHRRYITTTSFTNTVKPVYNDHSWDQMIVVSVDRWSMYGGALVQLKWAMHQPTMVSMDMWSSYAKWSSRQVSLQSQGGGGHSHKESKGDKPCICANKHYFHNFKRFPCPEMKPCTRGQCRCACPVELA